MQCNQFWHVGRLLEVAIRTKFNWFGGFGVPYDLKSPSPLTIGVAEACAPVSYAVKLLCKMKEGLICEV